MSANKVSFTELTHKVVQEARTPLTADEILTAVAAITPITTKNPKNTIRGAISASYLILAVGDGRYGWKMRLINGAVLRHTLQSAELAQKHLYWDDDLRDALWPTFFAPKKYSDRGPVRARLPDGAETTLTLKHVRHATWGSPATPPFWDWLLAQNPEPGDHLLFRVVDGEEKICAISFEPRRTRDEAAIARRNQELQTIARKRALRPHGAAVWELTAHLLATGFYRHPLPPEPISELWTEAVWGAAADQATPAPVLDPLVSALFGTAVQSYDFENPPDLPPEYDPAQGWRQPRQSSLARRGSVTSFTFRVHHRALPEVWRDLELAEDNTLEDLHLAFQGAYGWDDDHLYSFFMSGTSWDKATEIGSPWSDCSLHTHQVQIGALDLQAGGLFLYLFDYGDSHEFEVTLLEINPLAPKGTYPRTLAYHGTAPEQYPDYDSEEDGVPPYWG